MNIAVPFGAPLLAGALTRDQKFNYHRLNNSAILFSSELKVIGKYSKVHLVPFGEYVPLSGYLELGTLVAASGAFSPGDGFNLISFGDKKFGTFICFESIFPDIGRAFKEQGADFLVELTNDAWFERTSALYQHLGMAAFRAIETRLPLIRATNTGISSFINRNGKIEGVTRAFTEEILDGTITIQKGKTIYAHYGDWFFWLQGFVFISLVGYFVFKRKHIK
jgi:apolipoprotein N-acyltransferase